MYEPVPWSGSGTSVVPGGRFSGLDKCCMPSGGVGSVAAADSTVPSGAGPSDGPSMGIAGSAGAGAGSGMSGTESASAVGALNANAAMTPNAPDATASAVPPLFILAHAPFRIAC